MLCFIFAKGSVHGHLAPRDWVEHHDGGSTGWRVFVPHGRAETESREGLRTRRGPSKVGGGCHQRQEGTLPTSPLPLTGSGEWIEKTRSVRLWASYSFSVCPLQAKRGAADICSFHLSHLILIQCPLDARAQSHLGEVRVLVLGSRA